MTPVLLFAAGSSLIADYEESCAAAGLEIRAILANRPGPYRGLHPDRLRALEEAPEPLFDTPVLIPLFRPAHRRTALEELTAFLAARGRAPVPGRLVDPFARLPQSAALGEGGYVNAGAVVGAAARIGRWCVLNRACAVGHHSALEDFVSIGPGAVLAGEVRVGEGALIGAGAVAPPGTEIGARAVVAPGAVLRGNVPAGALVAGNPARRMRRGLGASRG